MGQGTTNRCPCGACPCIAYTDSWRTVASVWLYKGDQIAYWDIEGSYKEGVCPECLAILNPKTGEAIPVEEQEDLDEDFI